MRHQRILKSKSLSRLKRQIVAAEDNGWQAYGGAETMINPVNKQPSGYQALMVRDVGDGVWGFLVCVALPIIILGIWIVYSWTTAQILFI